MIKVDKNSLQQFTSNNLHLSNNLQFNNSSSSSSSSSNNNNNNNNNNNKIYSKIFI